MNVKLQQQSNGDYLAEFTPLTIGQHQIDVFCSNQPIAGSPFFANVYDADAAEITVRPQELIIGAENFIEGKKKPFFK